MASSTASAPPQSTRSPATTGGAEVAALATDPALPEVQGTERQALQGSALVLLAGVSYGGVTVLAKIAYDHGSNAPSSLVFRYGLAALLFWLYLLLTGKVQGQAQRLPRRKVGGFILMGVLFSGGSLLAFMAVERIGAGLAALLLYVYPAIVTAAAATFFALRITRSRVVILLASLLGCALTVDVQGGSVDPLGLALATGTAFTYSAYVLLASRITVGVSPLLASAWVISSGALLMLVVGITGAFGDRLTTQMDATGWLAILALALVSTVVANSAFLAGMARLDPFRAAVLSTIEPVVSVLLAALLLSERLSPQQALGGALIVGSAVALQVVGRARSGPGSLGRGRRRGQAI